MPDTSSASQPVNVVSDDDEDDLEETLLDTLLHQKYFNTSMIRFSSMMENDATLTGLIAEEKDCLKRK